MEKPINNHRLLSGMEYVFYLLFFLSVICAFRAISSITVGLLLLTTIIRNIIDTRKPFPRLKGRIFFWGCILFYLLQAIALLYTSDMKSGLTHLQLKSAMIFIPLILCCENYLDQERIDRLMKAFALLLLAAMLYCIAMAGYGCLFQGKPVSVFFYHALVKPFDQHAIQFSILVFAGIATLLDMHKRKIYLVNVPLHFVIMIFFFGFLVLLSSKLIIVFCLGYFVYHLLTAWKTGRGSRSILVGSVVLLGITGIILFFSSNPVSRRFNEIVFGDITVVRHDKFGQNFYFNGLQFRLLHWRFVPEILNENHAWLKGVSPGDSQSFIDNKYRQADMYTGKAGTPNRGFLGYNTHNQFLESLLQTGIPGLVAFVIICAGMAQMAIEKKRRNLSAIVLLLIAYSFNEAVFETQYGLMIFVFFPLFFYKQPSLSAKPG